MSETQKSKRTHILMTAMKLFTLKGYQLTSMQEIAESCKISKGSLYLHFKSKEELLFQIFLYFTQMLEEKMLLIEQDAILSKREHFMRQIEVLLEHFHEYREFLFVQVRESHHQMSEPFTTYIHTKQMELLRWLGKKVTEVYGESMRHYAIDLAIAFEGILLSIMRFFMFAQVPFSIRQMSQFLLTKLDHLVEGLRHNGGSALISEDDWSKMCALPQVEHLYKKHPILVLKEIKNTVHQLSLHHQQEEDLIQSIQILERELLDNSPRRAILLGMVHNLQQNEALEGLTNDLIEAMKPLFEITEKYEGEIRNEVNY